MKISLEKLAEVVKGKIYSDLNGQFEGFGTDTRKDLKRQLFIALKGDNFDAHDFCQKAVAAGATGLLIHRLPEGLDELRKKVSIIVVKDTLQALQDWAHFVRLQSKAKVVGITGSNGKTTSKEFTAAVLSPFRSVHYSKGSFNNHWGLPFSIMEEPPGTQVSLFEMGMNHAGEIKRLCEIAEPEIVVCSTVGRAHIEYFGTIEKIAEAKSEIYRYCRLNAQRIYNLDNEQTRLMGQKAKAQFPRAERLIYYSSSLPKTDVSLQIVSMTARLMSVSGQIAGEKGEAQISVYGAQNLSNLMLAASVGLACGLKPSEIWQSLPNCRTIWGRNQFVNNKKNLNILFDGYNANPDSFIALLTNVARTDAPNKIGVFGEMLELGDQAADLHSELGEAAGKIAFKTLLFFGAHFENFSSGAKKSGFKGELISAGAFDEGLSKNVISKLSPNDLVVVKASRGTKLERFVELCEPTDFIKS